MLLNQISHVTRYDRYPELFENVLAITGKREKILSFGCSTEFECRTLSEIYYPTSKIYGIDIDKKVIDDNKKNNNNDKIKYYDDINELQKNGKFDVIFALSVLCRWPKPHDESYSYEIFLNTVKLIDGLLKDTGFLCIFNSKYLFTDTYISKKYKIIETSYKCSGFIEKYTKNDVLISNYPYILFQKIGRCSTK